MLAASRLHMPVAGDDPHSAVSSPHFSPVLTTHSQQGTQRLSWISAAVSQDWDLSKP